MARTGDDLTSCKRDAKLENFLKQKLSESVFERVRAYEACIAQSKKVRRNFKFVVLSDERIYVTDNPPKVIREDESVHLSDVTSIRLVNEFPDFLSGDDRENSQHICIKYRTLVPITRRRKSLRDLLKQPEKKDGSDGDRARSNPSSGTSSPSLHLTTPKGEMGQIEHFSLDQANRKALQNGKEATLRLNHSFDESDLKVLRRMMDSEGEEEQEPDRLSLSLPTSELKKLSMMAGGSQSSSDRMEKSSSSSSLDRGKAVETCRPLPVRPVTNPGEMLRSIDVPDTFTTDLATALALPNQGVRRNSATAHRTLPSPETNGLKSEPFQFPPSPKANEKPKEHIIKDRNGNIAERHRLMKSKSVDSGSSKSNSSVGEEGDQEEVKKEEAIEELHIYLLSLSSPFLMHLRSSWNNYIVRSTLLKDSKMASRMGTSRTGSKQRQPSRDLLERQFQQLKLEITNSAHSMPDLFQLVQELCNAAEKYFVLKKLFWKNEDLFEFMITQLNRYLPKSQMNLQNNERGRHHRADELELAILLIESLGLMFRETEMVKGRLKTVKANNGKAVLDLVVVLTCLPEVPQRWRPPKSKAHSLLLETDADSWETYGDAEVFNLVKDLTDASTSVLFELILIAHQANWGNTEGRFFNICWIIKVLESLQTTTFKFVERLMSQAMRLLMPSSMAMLTPVQAVLLFQQFFVLQTLIQYSSSIAAHVRNNYTEEFRYYVRSPHIVNKLPQEYPITKVTLQLISEVLSHVLQERTVLQAPS